MMKSAKPHEGSDVPVAVRLGMTAEQRERWQANCRAVIARTDPRDDAAMTRAVDEGWPGDLTISDFADCRRRRQSYETLRVVPKRSADRGTLRRRGSSRPSTVRRQAVRGASRRSSARSGDSGSDEPSGEPAPGRPEATIERRCDFCNALFLAKYSTTRFCSDSHRAQHSRERRKQTVEPVTPIQIVRDCCCDDRALIDEHSHCLKCGKSHNVAPYYKALSALAVAA